MSVFVDTSALLPLLNPNDRDHVAAAAVWRGLLLGEETVVTSSYVLLETYALAQNRYGLGAVQGLRDRLCPVLVIEWVDPDLHEAGLGALITAGRRQLSLVDCVSFEVMRRRGIQRAFAFDAHFREESFAVLPAQE